MIRSVDNKKALFAEKFSTAPATTVSFHIWKTFWENFAQKFSKMYNFGLNKSVLSWR